MNSNPFAGATEKAQALREQFAALPESVIHGVIGARGASGGKGGKETMWNLNVELIAWRVADGPLQDSELKISKRVTDEELKRLQKLLRSETLVAISAKLCEHSPFGDARAQLGEVLAPPDDAALSAKLAAYIQPVEMHDPLLGKLVLNKAVNWFDGKATWLGQEVRFSVEPDDDNSPAPALQAAKSLWEAAGEWDEKARRYAAEEMLENKIENWLEEGEAELTIEQFMANMRLNSITFGPGGNVDFWFDDGDMFWGHAITVSGSLAEGFTDASIAG